jgi:hypothetical protein
MVHEAKPFGIPERLYALDALRHRCIGGSVLALAALLFPGRTAWPFAA